MGPMIAAGAFLECTGKYFEQHGADADTSVRCVLKGSLAFTGKGHNTHRAIALGLHGYRPESLPGQNMDDLIARLWSGQTIAVEGGRAIKFTPDQDIIFDKTESLPQHPNGMIFELLDHSGEVLLSETYFSIGGGFISTLAEISRLVAPLKMESAASCPYAFDSARSMLMMSIESGLSISAMKRINELEYLTEQALDHGLDDIWRSMRICVEQGLAAEGILPGGLDLPRRAKTLYSQLQDRPEEASLNDWLCAYAMAVNEENAAGHMVVTAPTNGAAGVIPAVLYYIVHHEQAGIEQVREFLLTASAIGGLIKHRSSISGAEVGCQGEVGSAAAMAAAGLCAVRGGTAEEIENAAEIALEHHLGMTCDPVGGLVQVPCIERNGFGAIKAYTAASLAIRGGGQHFMPLDSCIAAMKQTGKEMSEKFKETSLGGLAVSVTEC
jgi:L-serine dehydratase